MSDRRSFLVGAGASILAASALSERAAAISVNDMVEAVGLVSNSALPAPSGELLLNVYLAVENGTGFCTIGDVVHPKVNRHVEITASRRHGNDFEFDGQVIRSNDPARVGQPVLIVATVHGDATRLAVDLGGETFTGLGLMNANMASIS